jgi:hypothetical protein
MADLRSKNFGPTNGHLGEHVDVLRRDLPGEGLSHPNFYEKGIVVKATVVAV